VQHDRVLTQTHNPQLAVERDLELGISRNVALRSILEKQTVKIGSVLMKLSMKDVPNFVTNLECLFSVYMFISRRPLYLDNIASNGRLTDEFGKDLEGSGHAVIEVLTSAITLE
jgi:hypothetical protein